MGATDSARPPGQVFDTIAADYDAHRPTYPEDLVDRACGGLSIGDPVLEVGCGTGQLTRSLVARGLRVTAIDPGRNLLMLAAEQVPGARFVHASFETAELPRSGFRAVFSASAFHWVDPEVSWSLAADVLSPGGTLALLQQCGLAADDDQEALMAVLRRTAPQIAATWPRLRTLEVISAGVEERSANVTDVWSWIGQYDLGRRSAARLFSDVRAAAVPAVTQHTAAELIALLRTLSPYHRMTADQQAALESSVVALEEQLGRTLRSTTASVLVTARRSTA